MRNVRKASTGHARIVNSSTPRPPSSACNAQRVAPTRLWVTLCAFAPPGCGPSFDNSRSRTEGSYGSQRTRRLRTDGHRRPAFSLRHGEADVHRVQRGQHDRLGGSADLLRAAVPLPGTDRARLDHRAGGRSRDDHPAGDGHRHLARAEVRRTDIRRADTSGSRPGVVPGLVVWVTAPAAFAFYVGKFGSYEKTHGTLGGLVVLLIWMWLTNVSLKLGMELNAERERAKELAAGDARADKEIQLEPRAEPKDAKTT